MNGEANREDLTLGHRLLLLGLGFLLAFGSRAPLGIVYIFKDRIKDPVSAISSHAAVFWITFSLLLLAAILVKKKAHFYAFLALISVIVLLNLSGCVGLLVDLANVHG